MEIFKSKSDFQKWLNDNGYTARLESPTMRAGRVYDGEEPIYTYVYRMEPVFELVVFIHSL